MNNDTQSQAGTAQVVGGETIIIRSTPDDLKPKPDELRRWVADRPIVSFRFESCRDAVKTSIALRWTMFEMVRRASEHRPPLVTAGLFQGFFAVYAATEFTNRAQWSPAPKGSEWVIPMWREENSIVIEALYAARESAPALSAMFETALTAFQGARQDAEVSE